MRLVSIILLATWPGLLFGQAIDTAGVATVHITRDDASSSLLSSVRVYHVFPAYDFSQVNDSMPPNKREIYMQCPVRIGQEAYLTLADDELRLFVQPGDTVHVHVTLVDGKPKYIFDGRNKSVQEYYLAYRNSFPMDPAQQSMNAGVNAPNLVVFRQQIDSLSQTQTQFFQ